MLRSRPAIIAPLKPLYGLPLCQLVSVREAAAANTEAQVSAGRGDKSRRATQTAADTYYESIISRLALLKLSAALKVIWAEFRRIKALRKLDGVNVLGELLK